MALHNNGRFLQISMQLGGWGDEVTGLSGGGGLLSFLGYLFAIAKIAGSGWNITIF